MIATTEGLTKATTLAISGNVGASISTGGGVQSGSIGVAVEVAGGGLGGGDISIGGRQLLPRIRHRIIIRQVNRYFMFIPFIVDFIVARGQNLSKGFLSLSGCFAKVVKFATLV